MGVTGRSKRIWTDPDTSEALSAIGDVRTRLGRLLMRAPVMGKEYRAILRVDEAVKDLGFLLTGDKELFTAKPGRAPDMHKRAIFRNSD